MKLNREDLIILPETVTKLVAPSFFTAGPELLQNQISFGRALLYGLFGEEVFKMDRELVSFVVAGGLIKKLTGKDIIPPLECDMKTWFRKKDLVLWESLWQAICGSELETDLKNAICALFLPDCPIRTRPIYLNNELEMIAFKALISMKIYERSLNWARKSYEALSEERKHFIKGVRDELLLPEKIALIVQQARAQRITIQQVLEKENEKIELVK